MAALLVMAFGVIVFVAVPQWRGATVVLVVGVEAALLAHAATSDAYLAGATGIVGTLATIVLREIASGFAMLFSASDEARRRREQERRTAARLQAQQERERRRLEREQRRYGHDDRLAA